MRASEFHLSTTREIPAGAETISHQLMLRAGMIRQLASGLYTWLPLGLRVLRRVEQIVREEMDRSGALELLMPVVQPAELWQESGRWEQYGPELLRFSDRHERPFCLGPTHEEVITDLFRREIRSHRQLPVNFYQIQTKFRDEIRPRFGVMRAREFLMKDAYSFHLDKDCLDRTYQTMHATYTRIFTRLGLNFRAVHADSGSIGGSFSHEFHVLADSGEDAIAFSTHGNYAANVELAPALPPADPRPAPARPLTQLTPEAASGPRVMVHWMMGCNGKPVGLVLREEHSLNEIKTEKLPQLSAPLRRITPEDWARLGQGNPAAGLPGDMALIADEAGEGKDAGRALALAGIMGGEDSGIGASTCELFLESAFFSPNAIAGKASRPRSRRAGTRTAPSMGTRMDMGTPSPSCCPACARSSRSRPARAASASRPSPSISRSRSRPSAARSEYSIPTSTAPRCRA